MEVLEAQNLRNSQNPDKEENHNQGYMWKEQELDRNQLAQVQNPDLMDEFDAISWLESEDFILSDEVLASYADFGCLSSPSFSLPHPSAVRPEKEVLTNPSANPCPPSSSATLPSLCVPRSLPLCSSEMIMQSQESNPNPLAKMQLGINSSKQLLDDVLMVDTPGVCTTQPANLDLAPRRSDKMKNSSEIEGKEKEGDYNVTKFFLEWLKENEDAISPKDLRSICFKKSIVECTESATLDLAQVAACNW